MRRDQPGMLEATLAFNVLAAWMGAHVVRVHDVEEVAWALKISTAARTLRRSHQGEPSLEFSERDTLAPIGAHRNLVAGD